MAGHSIGLLKRYIAREVFHASTAASDRQNIAAVQEYLNIKAYDDGSICFGVVNAYGALPQKLSECSRFRHPRWERSYEMRAITVRSKTFRVGARHARRLILPVPQTWP